MSLIQIRHVLIHLLHGLFNGQLLRLSTREGQGLPSMPSAPSPRVLYKKTKDQTHRAPELGVCFVMATWLWMVAWQSTYAKPLRQCAYRPGTTTLSLEALEKVAQHLHVIFMYIMFRRKMLETVGKRHARCK